MAQGGEGHTGQRAAWYTGVHPYGGVEGSYNRYKGPSLFIIRANFMRFYKPPLWRPGKRGPARPFRVRIQKRPFFLEESRDKTLMALES